MERYLQAMVKVKVACESEELRIFLSQSPTAPAYWSRIASCQRRCWPPQVISSSPATPGKQSAAFPEEHSSRLLFKGMTGVAEGLDDLIGIGPSMLDVVVQRLSTQMQTRSGASLRPRHRRHRHGLPSDGQGRHPLPSCAKKRCRHDLLDRADLRSLHRNSSSSTRRTIGSVVKPSSSSCSSNCSAPPSRGRSARPSLLLSRLIHHRIHRSLQGESLAEWRAQGTDTTENESEKDLLRENANSKLASLIPELAANLVGRENAREGHRKGVFRLAEQAAEQAI